MLHNVVFLNANYSANSLSLSLSSFNYFGYLFAVLCYFAIFVVSYKKKHIVTAADGNVRGVPLDIADNIRLTDRSLCQ